MGFKTGQQIWVEGEVRGGMFPTERSFKVALPPPDQRTISGFAPQEFVREPTNGNEGMIAVFVFSKPDKGRVAVLFPGEILTSTNPVRVPFDWLMKQIH